MKGDPPFPFPLWPFVRPEEKGEAQVGLVFWLSTSFHRDESGWRPSGRGDDPPGDELEERQFITDPVFACRGG